MDNKFMCRLRSYPSDCQDATSGAGDPTSWIEAPPAGGNAVSGSPGA